MQAMKSGRPAGYTCTMSLHIVLPGLLWPSSPHHPPALQSLKTPALSRLAGCGSTMRRPALAAEYLLASLFGLDERAPFGALRRAGQGEAVNSRQWLAADAVHLRFARDALLLTDAPDVAPDAEEAAALCASWNAHFANVGWLYMGAGGHGHLALHEPVTVDTTPPGGALGRKIDVRLPSGPDGAKVRQWMNETQMLFHSHPVNAAREEAGRPAINSLWFWGAGVAVARAQARPIQVWSDNALARGMALAAGVRTAPLPAQVNVALLPDNLVVLDAALAPSLYLDAEAWAQAALTLEQHWIVPALAALRRGDVQTLTLTLSGDDGRIDVTVQRRDLMKFWRRPFSVVASS